MASRSGNAAPARPPHFPYRGVAAGASLAFGSLTLSASAQVVGSPTIGGTAKTQYGSVRGLLKEGVQQFWCVPYGAPTAGANRFMPPQKPAAWSGVKDHFEITWAAPMDPDGEEPSPVVTALNRKTPQSEDCLTVNVFTPGLDNSARPVMVWMHGGGFSAGSGNYLLYDGTNLAKKEDVVVVSVNHRLNLFGFLHLAGLGGEKWAQSTNVGVQDLVAALQRVKDNIESFGGDADRVTIFGQSGGGGKTTTVMAMPSARGLFDRSIAQSGYGDSRPDRGRRERRRRAFPCEARHPEEPARARSADRLARHPDRILRRAAHCAFRQRSRY